MGRLSGRRLGSFSGDHMAATFAPNSNRSPCDFRVIDCVERPAFVADQFHMVRRIPLIERRGSATIALHETLTVSAPE